MKIKTLAIAASMLVTACAAVNTTGNTENEKGQKTTFYYRNSTALEPVVVMEAGLGDGKSAWSQVVRKLPEDISLFAYDRPGYGGSTEDDTAAKDPCSIARNLHELLIQQGVKPPYILAGQNAGGLYQYYFARLYPQDVAGLVLLNPVYPEHWQNLQKEAPAKAQVIRRWKQGDYFSDVMRAESAVYDQCSAPVPDESAPLDKPVTLIFSERFTLVEKGSIEQLERKERTLWEHRFVSPSVIPLADSGRYITRDAPAEVAGVIRSMVDSAGQ